MSRAYFIAGTDTDVGKTTVAAGLLHAARLQGLSTLGAKPVASGCTMTPKGLRNSDAQALIDESTIKLPYEQVNPYAFEPAIAPHVAAREAGVTLDVPALLAAIRNVLQQNADFTLVEGAGGWRVPLSGLENLSDLAVALQLPVILVVGVRLGCISHALLSARRSSGMGCNWPGGWRTSSSPVLRVLKRTLPAWQSACLRLALGGCPN